MAAAKTEVIGLKEANRALRGLPEHARDEAQRTMDVTAFHFSRMAAAAAPRGETGRLQDAISWQSRPRSLSAVVRIVKQIFYWKFQEYGTVHHGARPFLRPTAVRMRPDHEARLRDGLSKALSKMEREAKSNG